MKTLLVLSVSLFILVLLDCITTVYGLAFKPHLREANSLVLNVGLIASGILKMALTSLLIVLFHVTVKCYGIVTGVKEAIHLIAAVMCGFYLAVVLNNLLLIFLS